MTIALAAHTLFFASPGDFAFCLQSRTNVPAERFGASMERPPEELWREAEEIKNVEKRLVAIIANTDGDRHFHQTIHSLSLKLFSNDHGWREIFAALSTNGPDYGEYQRIALVKYLQYLGARQEILRIAFSIQNQGHAGRTMSVCALDTRFEMRETVIFDTLPNRDHGPASNPLRRLPQGEPTLIAIPGDTKLEIVLARHAFSLAQEHGWALTDSHGAHFQLHVGRNTVGRGRGNDVALGSEYRNVSRQHMIVEIAEQETESTVWLTDISSHGTYVPRSSVAF